MTREVDPMDPAALERINKVLEDEFMAAMTTVPAPAIERTEATVERVAEYARWLEEQVPKPMEKIKLTKNEWDVLRAANPPINRPPSLLDVPVELVDNPEESTLYRPPCCDGHSEQCEVSTQCCDACPEPVAMRAFVGEYEFGLSRPPVVWHSRSWSYPTIAEPEPVEPRADQTRGWLARAIERWFG